MKQLLALSLAGLMLAGCATPTVVDKAKVDDGQLSCEGLKEQIAEADRFEEEARAERKVTGKNVAAAVFFWPALLGTYANTEEAIEAAQARKEHLTKLFGEKGCQ